MPAPSLNWVPPTAILFGVEARPLTLTLVPATAFDASQAAAPLSPEDTKAVIPCAAAWVHKVFQKLFPDTCSVNSHSPKLVLIIFARFVFTMNCAERATPSVAPVCDITKSMVAFFAIAPDHSTSRSASVSSVPPRSPGSAPLWIKTGSLAGRPKKLRKNWTSVRLISVRPTIAIVWPVPSMAGTPRDCQISEISRPPSPENRPPSIQRW